ncbi:Hsp20/alpha crystallin family protein [Natronosalvus halobius]|uniref:Hsp20/alpha crystallin family protein n=1 Tax=Natronosalvus halobius TaxID=2953746 RepID=UPI00209DD37A|nr:Hsp20/alpha crystallin family protein [Natronosalvus halobius]USZ73032.1 Hsp20/alpha crystallin family protein [Natronosalvus halobius]
MSALRDALRDLSDAAFFDLLESDDSYLLVLDVPGVAAETIDVVVEDGRIRIEARRQKDLPGEYHYLEENRPLFLDVDLPLPDDATESNAEASVDRGVLELTLPKREGSDRTPIDVVSDPEDSAAEDVDGDADEDG